MQTSPSGVAFIAAHEGVVTKAYRDVKGVWTIGVGHTAAAGDPHPKAGMTMTRQQALSLLATDLPNYEAGVAAALGGVGPAAFDGGVSFHYNTGAIRRATWVKKFKAASMAEAEAALKAWNKSGGRIYKGLVRRRAEEADLIFRGLYPAGIEADETRPASASVEEIASCQAALAELGYGPDRTDGIASPATAAAILAFQRDAGLVADGVVGPATRATLARKLAAKRAAKLATAAAGAGGATGGGLESSAGPANAIGLETLLWIGGGALAAGLAVALALLLWRYRGAVFLTLQRITARIR